LKKHPELIPGFKRALQPVRKTTALQNIILLVEHWGRRLILSFCIQIYNIDQPID
jgi:hypothetical protein